MAGAGKWMKYAWCGAVRLSLKEIRAVTVRQFVQQEGKLYRTIIVLFLHFFSMGISLELRYNDYAFQMKRSYFTFMVENVIRDSIDKYF